MSEFTPEFQPEQIYDPLKGYTAEETERMYPFGYFVFPDGQIFGRDPLQEANAGIDVPEEEISRALTLIAEESFGVGRYTNEYEYYDASTEDFTSLKAAIKQTRSK